jgi:hypothetical protein
MNILFLGPENPLVGWLTAQGEHVVRWERRLRYDEDVFKGFDWIISYGIRAQIQIYGHGWRIRLRA